MKSPIRILLAEDHQLVRAGIRALLQKIEGMEVVAEVGDGREALDLIKKHQPNVVLMDIAMPSLNGLDATARIAKDFPNVRVIILSVHSSEEHVYQALRAGAAGYLLKDAGPAELETAIRAVAEGEKYLTPKVSKNVISNYVQGGNAGILSLRQLTPRQREVLQTIAEGRSTKEIADMLNVSVKTVETHRAQLMEKLDIHEVAGLVRYAIRVGLIPPD